MSSSYTFIEICAGGGGLSSGLIEAGFTPIFLNDNNKDCCKTLKHNHKNVDIKSCSMTDIDFTPYIGKVDLLCGGVPCQSFSMVGKRRGFEDKRGDLFLKFIDIIFIVKPKIFLIENVKGLLNHDKGKTFKYILDYIREKCDEEKINYNIDYKVLNSFDYEVPQKRERLIMIGSLTNIYFPEERKKKILLKDVLINVPYSDGSKYSDKKIELYKYIPQGGCWINLPENLQKEYLGNSFNSGGGKRGILYRLSMEKPSLTLLCSPSQKQTERCHPLENRPLRIREYARIQTFSDDYVFIGSITSQYKQIGNAVPPRMAYYIGLSLKKSLDLL